MDQTKLIDYQGKKMSMKSIARLNDVNYLVLRNKYKLTNGDIEQAIATVKAVQKEPYKYVDFFGKKMTIKQIAKIYGVSGDNLQDVYKQVGDIDEAVSLCVNNLSVEKNEMQKDNVNINKLKNLDYSSFHEKGLKDNDHLFLNNNTDPNDLIEKKILTDQAYKRLSSLMNTLLSAKERKILCLYYGIEDRFPRSMDEIAHIYNVTQTYIRKVVLRSLRKIRNHESIYILKENTGVVPVAELKSFVSDIMEVL